ncbi:hypothetical protein KJ951_00660 [Patescibacteria group bacterium]|nr:hypothetical protein [Patescibacteria group bacterium]MBU1702892.1 hypothetical protein [Patescibacteria group bacterium]MBU1954057.1 hypothetical protein [Patescibacteria group bacterium]
MAVTKYSSVYLAGFRATGKTTIGKAVALKLGWDFVDMDKEIQQNSAATINELTKGGEDWRKFRALEQELLKKIIGKKKIVVAMGGGTTVNDVPANINESFGAQNWKLLRKAGALVILLTANEKIIADRMRAHEMRAPHTVRPPLKSVEGAPAARSRTGKKDLVEAIIKDSIKTFREREKAYLAQTSHIIDTGKTTKQEAVKRILSLL